MSDVTKTWEDIDFEEDDEDEGIVWFPLCGYYIPGHVQGYSGKRALIIPVGASKGVWAHVHTVEIEEPEGVWS